MPWIRKDEYERLKEIADCLEIVKPGVIRNHHVVGEDRITFKFGIKGQEDGERSLAAFRRAFDLCKAQYFRTFQDAVSDGATPMGSILYYFKDPKTGKAIVPPKDAIEQFIQGHLDGIEQMENEIKALKQLMEGDLVGEEL